MNEKQTGKQTPSEPVRPAARRRSWLWRALRICLLGLVTLITLFVLFHLEENWRGSRAWKNYKARMEAQGTVFRLQDLAPPPVPDAENFAMTPLLKPLLDLWPADAEGVDRWEERWRDPEGKQRVESILVNDPELDALQPYGMGPAQPPSGTSPVPPSGKTVELPKSPNWRLGQRFHLEDWQAYYAASDKFPSGPPSNGAPEAVLKALSLYDAELAELKQAAQRPYSRFDIEYDSPSPYSILLTHLSALRNIAVVLQLKAVAELQAGKTEAAFEDVNLVYALAESIKNEPLIIDLLVRFAILDRGNQALWEGLVAHRWTADQLLAFQNQLSGLDLIKRVRTCTLAERACGTEMIERCADNPGVCAQEVMGTDSGFLASDAFKLIPRGWIYMEALNFSRAFDDSLLPCLPEQGSKLNVGLVKSRYGEFMDELGRMSQVDAFLSHRLALHLLIPALEKVVVRSAEAQAMTDMAVISLAMERYRLAKGAYPESLDRLSPEWLANVPNDPVTHEPFHYEPHGAESYRLWSVGWNEKDDGGVVVYREANGERSYSREQLDWVWPSAGDMEVKLQEE